MEAMASDTSDRRQASAQLHRQIVELKERARKRQNVYKDEEAWSEHQQIQSLCQKLIVDDPEYAVDKKVEHDLWNVCFKEHIGALQSSAKDKTSKGKKSANEAQVVLSWFLEMASGFYIMLLHEIRATHDLDIPFLKRSHSFGLFRPSPKEQSSKGTVIYLVQHCIVHLGDIARYRNQTKTAEDFYRKAIHITPGSGQAYNQIALLELSRGDKLSAVFFYVRALAVRHPFPAAAANLSRLLDRIEQEHRSIPPSTGGDEKAFLANALRFVALLHHATKLKTSARRVCNGLNESLTSIVAAESLSTWQTIQIVTLDMFLMHRITEESPAGSEDERAVVALVCEAISGMLSAFLLPVYTLKQGASLLDYFALPATKIILDWIVLNPTVLEERGFLKRLQIWPSLCRVLNNLSDLLAEQDTDEESIADIDEYPLPEDHDLQAFAPLHPRLRELDFKRLLRMKEERPTDEKLAFLRAQRLIDAGMALASATFQGRKMVRATIVGDSDAVNQKVCFVAVEHKIPEELLKEEDSHADESEDESGDEEDPTPEFEDVSERSNSSGTGILKTSPSREAAAKPKAQRTNVAMEAIMRHQRQQSEDVELRRQVAFRTPTPEPPVSLPRHSIEPQWLPRAPMPPRPMMPPALPPPVMTGVPGNPDPRGLRSRFGSAEQAPFLPIRPLSSSTIQQPRRPQMDFSRMENYQQNTRPQPHPWMGQQQGRPLPEPANLSARFSQPPPNIGGPLNMDPRNTWPTPAPAAAPMTSPRLPSYNPSTGPTYSLFSGPSWQQQQHQHPQHQNHNMFQSGPSALESLLRQQRNEKQ